MPERTFPSLVDLISQSEAAAAGQPDALAILVALLKLVIASDADPYLLTGALVEGIATTVAQRIPAIRQGAVAVASVQLLRDRLHTYGAI